MPVRSLKVLGRLSDLTSRHARAVFLTPTVVFIIVMMAFPIGYTLYLSFHTWTGGLTTGPEFVGFDNYRQLLTSDARFWPAFGNTLLFTLMGVAAQTVLGIAIAVLLNREFVGRGVTRSLFLLPMIATPVAVALVWRLMFQPQLGILNDILGYLGIGPLQWTSSRALVLPSIALVDTWEWTPLIALITLAGLSAIPPWPYEAAAVDGASLWQVFRYVTLPMVRPVLVVAVVFRMIEALKTFDLILVISGGGPGFASETVNVYAYRAAFQYQRLGYVSALLILFFVIILVMSAVVLRLRRARDD